MLSLAVLSSKLKGSQALNIWLIVSEIDNPILSCNRSRGFECFNGKLASVESWEQVLGSSHDNSLLT